jgi:FtsZ-binding cell division protein ZapB
LKRLARACEVKAEFAGAKAISWRVGVYSNEKHPQEAEGFCMSDSALETEVADEVGPPIENRNEIHPQEAHTEPDALAVSVNDFEALEERIRRAVELVKRVRVSRAQAEERATNAEQQLRGQAPVVEQLQAELHALRAERDQVRQRVERLLGQLDALEL